LAVAVLLAGCGGSRPGGDDGRIEPGKEKLIDALTLFVEALQGERYDLAMAYLTPAERAQMLEGNGSVTPAIQRRLRALRLSTLANKPGVRLSRGKLEGIYPWLPNVEHTPARAGEIPPPLP
jgi:hypothetical protein